MSDTGTSTGPTSTRVAVVDDSTLFRDGLATLLGLAGFAVVARLGSPAGLPAVLRAETPHVVVMDVRMPPTHTDEGIRAALATRAGHPDVGVLVLSTYAEGVWARRLFAEGSSRLGYLLKDRVDDVATLVGAIDRVRAGGTVVDPEVVDRLLAISRRQESLAALTSREEEVLRLMATGRSNEGIGRALHLSPRTVEAHIAAVFTKLALPADDNTSNRRVLAALAYLEASGS